MKVTCIEKVQFVPGKWKEASECMKTFKELAKKMNFPPYKIYGNFAGGDVVQTLYFVSEWNSLAEMESLTEKMFSDAGMREMMEQWAGVVASHDISILKELSEKELGI